MKANLLEKFKNHVVVITIKKNETVPYIKGVLLALLEYDEPFWIVNHPYRVNDGWVESGKSTFNVNDIIDIREATDEEYKTWKDAYIEFHNEILEEKGYDSCQIPTTKFLGLAPQSQDC